ncbi:FkbM family methyltransferase [uncultured Flavobacterium sp.]|uniref:FkbM family methyltransferase n=1 Tax=uncultured Flavobacterium sp. TaxID=165435 RepID=UPI0030EE9CD6|tara:strand:- start:11356 stop:12093 length:738 start_codon:yes stop_codon:yes gene_type:complete
MRLTQENRKLFKNEYDDMVFLFKKLKRNPKIIFDCGANVGFVTYQFNKNFPNSLIYAFEPNPQVYKVLCKESIKQPNKIFTYNLGIGEDNSKLDFYKNNNTGTSSFLKPNDFHMSHLARKHEIITVPIIKIEEFCNENSIENIGILKLDIEGYELKALKGCLKLLENNKIDFIYAEVNLVPTYEGQCLMEEVVSFLRKLNYIPYNIYGNNETKLRESFITNILFISSQVAKELNNLEGNNSVFTN